MAHQKRMQFYPSKQNEDWLLRMEEKGVSKTSLINLALDILLPRTGNIGSSESAIKTAVSYQKLIKAQYEENLDF